MNCKLSKLFFIALTLGVTYSGKAQTEEERKTIVKDYNLKELERFEVDQRATFERKQKEAFEYAKLHNIEISGITNDGQEFSLIEVEKESGKLKYLITNNNRAKGSLQTARANQLHEGGTSGLNLSGQGMIVGIWDGGQPLSSHVGFASHRIVPKDNTTATSDHGTHVAGTMAANGDGDIETKGFAPKALVWSNDFNGDMPEMTSQSAQGLLLSNHSYGIGYDCFGLGTDPAPLGKYNSPARTLDQLLFMTPNYLPVFAAGNDRSGSEKCDGSPGFVHVNVSKQGADLLYGEAVSKNNVVVAAVQGIDTYGGAEDVVMSEFSNWGPSDDYRIKPDISAKGVAVKSLSNAGSTATTVKNGTSMAAPAVTGVFVLWQEYYKKLWPTRINMKAATVKALMAATADEAGKYFNKGSNSWLTSGEGPDHRFGWGLINAEKGANVLTGAKANNGSVILEERTLNNGEIYETTFNVPEGNDQPIIATIAWTDPAGTINSGSEDDSSRALVNDLDLRIFRPNGQEILPWKLNKDWTNLVAMRGDNDVDNIEKVEYKGAATGVAGAGTYTIRVSHKGTLNGATQNYSLVVYSGLQPASNANFKFDGVNVFPNPTTDYVNIFDENGLMNGGNITVYDIQGKQLLKRNGFMSSMKVDLSGLSNGVYLMELHNNGQKQVVKIVKK